MTEQEPMTYRRMEVADITPASYNPRVMSDKEYEDLKKGIQKYGLVEPLVYNDDTSKLVSGHQRLRALQDLGITHCEVVVVKLSKKEERALNIALNKISGDWDNNKLKSLLTDLRNDDFDMELTGFHNKELDKLLENTTINVEGISPDQPSKGIEVSVKQGKGQKRVNLFFNKPDHQEFIKLMDDLSKHYGTDNITDTVIKAARIAKNHLPPTPK